MVRTLLRKQMMEVFSWLYQDKKSGKHRTVKGIVGWGLLYLLLFAFLGVMFGIAAVILCKPLLTAKMGWIYWCLMGMLAIFFGVFGSVFNTYCSIYQAKDNDMLLSMPIPTSKILLVRLSGVYAMGLMYEMIVMIPTVLIWLINAPLSIVGTIHVLLLPFVLSLLILVLSDILGWVVALIATKVKHKNIIIVLTFLVFISIYYYLSSRAYFFIQVLLFNLETVGNKLKTAFYLLYHMGMAAQGNILSMIVFTSIVVVASAITYLILSHSFLKLTMIDRGAGKTVYKEQKVKVKSVQSALMQKEFIRFTGSANYMLNCGLGMFLMPVSAAVLVWKADQVTEFISIPAIRECNILLSIAGICLLMTMNDMTAPSISLEGKNLWIIQSLPVSGKQVLHSKLKLALFLTWISSIPLVSVVEWLIKPSLPEGILIPAAVCLYAVVLAEIGLVLNLKMPNLHWTSESVPLKQSAPVTIFLFGSWLIIVVFAGVYVLLKNIVSVTGFGILLCGVFIITAVLLYHWLMTKGVKIFEAL